MIDPRDLWALLMSCAIAGGKAPRAAASVADKGLEEYEKRWGEDGEEKVEDKGRA